MPNYKELVDQIYASQPTVPTPEAPTSTLDEMGKAFKQSIYGTLPTMAGQAIKSISPVGSSLYGAGEYLQESGDAISNLPELQRHNYEGRGELAKLAISGASGVGQMVPVIGAGIINPYLGAATAASLFGGSTFQDTKEKMLKQEGLDDTYAAENPDDPRVIKATQTGLASGAIQGLGEGAMGFVGGKFLKGIPLLGKVGEKIYAGSGIRRFAVDAAGKSVLEGGTEVAQDEAQAAVERAAGVRETPGLFAQAAESFRGGAGTSLLLSPLGIPGHYQAARNAKAQHTPTTDDLMSVAAQAIAGKDLADIVLEENVAAEVAAVEEEITPRRRPVAGLLPEPVEGEATPAGTQFGAVRSNMLEAPPIEGELIPAGLLEAPKAPSATVSPEGVVMPEGVIPQSNQLEPPTINVTPNGTAVRPEDVNSLVSQPSTIFAPQTQELGALVLKGQTEVQAPDGVRSNLRFKTRKDGKQDMRVVQWEDSTGKTQQASAKTYVTTMEQSTGSELGITEQRPTAAQDTQQSQEGVALAPQSAPIQEGVAAPPQANDEQQELAFGYTPGYADTSRNGNRNQPDGGGGQENNGGVSSSLRVGPRESRTVAGTTQNVTPSEKPVPANLKKFASLFGLEVRGVEGLGAFGRMIPGTTIVEVDMSQTPAEQFFTVAMHEIIHHLQEKNPEGYAQLLAVAMKSPEFKAKIESYGERLYADKDVQYQVDESLAQFIAERAQTKEFWTGVIDEQPSLFSKLRVTFKRLLTGKVPASVKNVLTEIDKAAVDALREYAGKKGLSAEKAKSEIDKAEFNSEALPRESRLDKGVASATIDSLPEDSARGRQIAHMAKVKELLNSLGYAVSNFAEQAGTGLIQYTVSKDGLPLVRVTRQINEPDWLSNGYKAILNLAAGQQREKLPSGNLRATSLGAYNDVVAMELQSLSQLVDVVHVDVLGAGSAKWWAKLIPEVQQGNAVKLTFVPESNPLPVEKTSLHEEIETEVGKNEWQDNYAAIDDANVPEANYGVTIFRDANRAGVRGESSINAGGLTLPRTVSPSFGQPLSSGQTGEVGTNGTARESRVDADPSPEEAAKVETGIKGKSLIEAADWLRLNSVDPSYKLIAAKVLARLRGLEAAGVAQELNIVNEGDESPRMLEKARGVTSLGPNDIAVYLNGSDMAGLVGTSEETLLHELVHAATMGTLEHPVSKEQIKGLSAVAKAIDTHLKNNTPQTLFEQNVADKVYDYSDPHELVAWALSSPDMQAFLESVPYHGGTLWTKFVEVVRSFLGLPARVDSALSEVLKLSEQVLTHPIPTRNAAGKILTVPRMAGKIVRAQETERLSRLSDPDVAREWINTKIATGFRGLAKWLLPFNRAVDLMLANPAFKVIHPFLEVAQRESQLENALQDGLATISQQITQKWMDEGEKNGDLDESFTVANAASLFQLSPDKSFEDQDWLVKAKGNEEAANDAWKRSAGKNEVETLREKYNLLRAKYNALKPSTRKAYLETVQHVAQTHEETINSWVKMLEGLPETLETIKNEVSKVRKRFGKLNGNYLPLGRFGNWKIDVLELNPDGSVKKRLRSEQVQGDYAMNQKFIELQKKYPNTKINIVDVEPSVISKPNRISPKMMEQVQKLLAGAQDAAKFNAGKQLAKEWEETLGGSMDEDQRKLLHAVAVAGGPASQQAALKAMLNDATLRSEAQELMAYMKDAMEASGLSSAYAASVVRGIESMYIASLPESSILKNSMRRKGIPGFEVDAIRSAQAYLQKHARSIAYMKHGRLVDKALSEGFKAAQKSDDQIQGAEAQRRITDLRNNREALATEKTNPIVKNLNTFASMAFLSSPSIWVVQHAQPWTVVLPKLMSKFGIGKSIQMLWKHSMKTLTTKDYDNETLEAFNTDARYKPQGWPTDKRFTVSGLYQSLEGADKQKLLSRLKADGKLDLLALQFGIERAIVSLSQTHELMQNVIEGDARTRNKKLRQVEDALLYFQKMSELQSRKGSFMATFALHNEKNGLSGFDKSVDDTTKDITDTLFDYAAKNRARIITGSLGRLVGQFRTFQLQLIGHVTVLLAKATKSENHQERQQARQELAGFIAMNFALAGLSGLPLAGTVFATLNAVSWLFGSPDDPWDLERDLREWMMKQGKAGEIAMNGMPMVLGADLSKRIGASNAFDLFNGTPPENANAQAKLGWYAQKLLGPAYGATMGTSVEISEAMRTGDWGKAVTKMVPKPIGDVAKALQLTGGLKDGSGKVLIAEKDINLYDVALMMVGVNPAQVSIAREKERNVKEVTGEMAARKSRLTNDLEKAVATGDADVIQSVSSKMSDFNQKNPMFGFTSSGIATSIKGAMKKQMGVDTKQQIAAEKTLGRTP